MSVCCELCWPAPSAGLVMAGFGGTPCATATPMAPTAETPATSPANFLNALIATTPEVLVGMPAPCRRSSRLNTALHHRVRTTAAMLVRTSPTRCYARAMEFNLEPSDAPVRASATVVMLRDGASGLEVFLVKRHGLSDVLGGAYVFPGGKVDSEDADAAMHATLELTPQQLHSALNEPALQPA